jgi:hypothetical protein
VTRGYFPFFPPFFISSFLLFFAISISLQSQSQDGAPPPATFLVDIRVLAARVKKNSVFFA